MNTDNTIWNQSVTGVVIREGKVLLGRHTYGSGVGKLIVPGGYMEQGESPVDAVIREYHEETGITINPTEIIAIRFNTRDWYVAFRADYVSGEAHSDNDENNEVIWLDVDEALIREDVPDLTKTLIRLAVDKREGFRQLPYESSNNTPNSLWGI